MRGTVPGTILLTLLLLTSCPALEWTEGTERQIVVGVGDSSVPVRFPFRNDSGETITITGVTSSCGCITSGIDGSPVAPGGEGAVRIDFAPELRSGAVRKTARVRYHGADQRLRQVDLVMQFQIERLIQADSSLLSFHSRGPLPQWKPATRSFRVTDPGVRILGVDASEAPHFSVSLIPGEEPGQWSLRGEPLGYLYDTKVVEKVYVLTDHPLESCRRIPFRCYLFHAPPRAR